MKLKIAMDANVIYYARFIKEYDIHDLTFDNFFRIKKGVPSTPFINSYYSNMSKEMTEVQKLYSNIMQLFQTHLDYRNIKANYQIQSLVLVATIISVFVAIMTLLVAVNTNQAVADIFNTIWNFIKYIWNSLMGILPK